MTLAYVALGANLGDREANLRAALAELKTVGEVRKVATIIETEPLGAPGQGRYLNTVCEIETGLVPEDLLAACQRIEKKLGREREQETVRWGARLIDLDILLYGDEVTDTAGLTIPHPEMANRCFVLEPLAEIAPDARHPVLKKTAAEMLAEITPSTLARGEGRGEG